MKKNTDYIPGNDDTLRAWIVNFLAKLTAQGAAIGITTAEQSLLNSLGGAAVGAVDNLNTKKNEYESAVANRNELRAQFLLPLRPIVRRAKTNANYTDTIGEILGIIGADTPIDPATIQPEISVNAHMSEVSIRINRKGAQSVDLFVRIMGQANWTRLTRVTRASYVDTRPLAQPGVPEIREYMAQGFIGDTSVGLPSQSKAVIFTGALAA